MQTLKTRIKYALSNEAGSPSVEQILLIGAAICVGVAVYKFGGKAYDWITGAGDVVEKLEKQAPEAGPWKS